MTFQRMLFPEFKEKALTLSYDDGRRDDIKLLEIMSKYGLKGTFNLTSGVLNKQDYVRDDELYKFYIETGNEIAVHGVKHAALPCLTDEQIIEEIIGDRKALEKILGGIVTGMAYAYGAYDDRVVDILKKCGITYSRTVDSTYSLRIDDEWLKLKPTCHHGSGKLFELTDEFLSDKKENAFWKNHPKLFYLWGHSYEFSAQNNWSTIEEFAKKIGNRDDVWYATNMQIVEYVEAFKSLKYSADNSSVYNPTGIDVYIKTFDGAKVKIKAKQTVGI